MTLDTRRPFTTLLSRMQISAICDVGRMNGADALTFRAAASRASISALEPNPHNLRQMNADRVLQKHHVQIQPLAATNYDGIADFFLVIAHVYRKLCAACLRRYQSMLRRKTAGVLTTW